LKMRKLVSFMFMLPVRKNDLEYFIYRMFTYYVSANI